MLTAPPYNTPAIHQVPEILHFKDLPQTVFFPIPKGKDQARRCIPVWCTQDALADWVMYLRPIKFLDISDALASPLWKARLTEIVQYLYKMPFPDA